MDLDEARAFLREHHRGVLATRRADGRTQQSPVLINIDGEGRAIISSRETAYKVRNLRRDPRAQACVFTDRFSDVGSTSRVAPRCSRSPRRWIR